MGLGKLMPRRHLRPSEASTALPMACPGGGVRKITWAVPAMMRGDERALAGPIDSKCLATISSAFNFSAKDEGGAARATHRRARAMDHFCRMYFRRWIIVSLWLTSLRPHRCQKPDREKGIPTLADARGF